MAKRMFSTDIVESDAFLDMPLTAQSLYMHLNMAADNDGFVNPKRIMRMCGAANDDLQILIAKRFLLSFDSGVVVVKHWWINNTKRHDRHVPTSYQTEFELLGQKTNKSYTLNKPQLALETEVGNQPATTRQPKVASMQLNAMQYNPIQSNAAQPKKGFVKTIKTKEQKRAYAKAVRADEEQAARVAKSSTERKGYDSFASAGELLKKRGLKNA